MGVLFKNGAALEHLHSIDTVVLDKTGTLTTGKPAVTDIFPGSATETELLRTAAALEKPSEHPFAVAILERAKELAVPAVTEFETLPGMGVTGVVLGKRYFGGNKRLMEQHNIPVPEHPELTAQGKTPLYFGDEDGNFLGVIAAADVLKADSVTAVHTMHELKLTVVMLTGDNEATAQAIAQSAGIHRVVANVLPTDKAAAVKALQAEGRKVLMVGDGINDAPALVTADVGMAIGAGTDIAMESADVVLMSGSLTGIANAIRLSKATMRNIRQNLFWAFFYNCLGIPLAAAGMLSPMIGAAAMSFSSVFVVTNALRLRRFKTDMIPVKENIKEEKIMTTVINVNGMMCPHCKAMVEKVCKAVPGTVDAVVDLQAKNVTVTGDADVQALKQAIINAGYEVV
jgi:Cu+-exporting ATPase